MRIGFDAKRYFFNSSGLGNYSRNLVHALSKYERENEFFLFTPTLKKALVLPRAENISTITPYTYLGKMFGSLWRSFAIAGQLKKHKIDVYHGLSHELPFGIEKTGIKSLVTIHDLIFMRHPELFSPIDRLFYAKKVKHSCTVSNKIIAISEQTKDDITELLKIDEEKLEIIYQGCDPRFYNHYSPEQKKEIEKKYQLPENYLLSVGTIEKRKNALLTLQALKKGGIDTPFYIVGRKTPYSDLLNEFVIKNSMEKQVKFLHHIPTEDLPLLYQGATAFIYPSIYEGFGIPVLEALNSKVPVITGTGKCLQEVGGKNTIYVDPYNVDEMIQALNHVLDDNEKRNTMINAGLIHAEKFKEKSVAHRMMEIYKSV